MNEYCRMNIDYLWQNIIATKTQDTKIHKYSNVKIEEWILLKKEYQTGFTGSSGYKGLRPKVISPKAKNHPLIL